MAVTIDDFWSEVEEDDGLTAILSELVGKQIAGSGDIDDAAVRAIWEGRSKYAELTPLVNRLVVPIEDRRRPLETLRQRLVDDLQRKTAWYGKLDTLADTAPKMIFVDYYMGPRAAATRRSWRPRKLLAISTNCTQGAEFKPVIVLMSSANVSPEVVENFRRSSGWLAGMFYFINKEDFEDADVFFIRLVSFAQVGACWLPGCKR